VPLCTPRSSQVAQCAPATASRNLPVAFTLIAILVWAHCAFAQEAPVPPAPSSTSADPAQQPAGCPPGTDSACNPTPAVSISGRIPAHGAIPPVKSRPFSRIGIDAHAGLNGIGFDVATPLARKFNLRAGADFFSYNTSFTDQGADITIDLRLRSGHASLDWFPFGGRFRLSPLLVFGNNNLASGTALVPAGSTITLDGQDYISSYTDPLHGNGSIDFRKIAPGLSLGFGNIIPRTRSHFSIPVEAGLYYSGQPGLKVTFTGSACDRTQPAAIGCESVNNDAGFQKSLAAFIARNNNNLSYASFFPILSVGVGYKF
jgi:hypothetical protein